MELANNTILVTGGASGIGLALTERFIKAGSQVIICGRREDKLREVKSRLPQVHTRVCDVAKSSDREALAKWITAEFPHLNVLINNAGIQRRVALLQKEDWNATQEEIAINFEAPVHLTTLLLPHLVRQKSPTVINITSGLAFVPLTLTPVYSATKAAMHSFTVSLRHQLSKTPVQVLEVAPPAVNTDLGGKGMHDFGVPLNEFADAAFKAIGEGKQEWGYQFSEKARLATREEQEAILKQLHRMVPDGEK